MMYISLDELDWLRSRLYLFSNAWPSPYAFDPCDHLPDLGASQSLAERVKQFARSHGLQGEIARIQLLTNFRVFGYVFNPVSFFFCFDCKGDALCCIAEVGNTFQEKKAYLLKLKVKDTFSERQQKLFYISPFTELTQDLSFEVDIPDDALHIRIDTVAGETRILTTYLKGKRLAFNDKNLLALTLRYPLATAQVIALIHWHALSLWLKGTPFHSKDEGTNQQTQVMNKHRSLRKSLNQNNNHANR